MYEREYCYKRNTTDADGLGTFPTSNIGNPGCGVLLVAIGLYCSSNDGPVGKGRKLSLKVTNNGYIVHKLLGSIGIYRINWYIHESVHTLVALSPAST